MSRYFFGAASRKSVCQNFGHEPDEAIFLNAEDADALAEVSRGQFFSASFGENLYVLCGKMNLIIHAPQPQGESQVV